MEKPKIIMTLRATRYPRPDGSHVVVVDYEHDVDGTQLHALGAVAAGLRLGLDGLIHDVAQIVAESAAGVDHATAN